MPLSPQASMMSREDYGPGPLEAILGELFGQDMSLPFDSLSRYELPNGQFVTGENVRAEAPHPSDIKDVLNIMKAFGKSPARTDPRLIAGKKWYHGSGTKGITPEAISPYSTKASGNLYGQGIYLTDNSSDIPRGYSKARSRKGRGEEVLYEARVSPEKILDLDELPPKEVRDVFEDLTVTKDRLSGEPDSYGYSEIDPGGSLSSALDNPNSTVSDYYDAVRYDLSDFDTLTETADEVFDGVSFRLRQNGYDALTHTGGLRSGNERHQVLIMLDPNNEMGLADEAFSASQVRSFDEMPKARYGKSDWPMFSKAKK
jgi:hypothetical protein